MGWSWTQRAGDLCTGPPTSGLSIWPTHSHREVTLTEWRELSQFQHLAGVKAPEPCGKVRIQPGTEPRGLARTGRMGLSGPGSGPHLG